MFAYCYNSPISYIDSNGYVALSCFKEYTDPFNSPWENGSAGGGTQVTSVSYLFFAGLKHSRNEEISDIYTSMENLVASSNFNDAMKAWDALNQEEIVKYGKNIGKIVSGAKNVGRGIVITLTPNPIPIKNAAGPITFAFGVINVIWGTIAFIVELEYEK